MTLPTYEKTTDEKIQEAKIWCQLMVRATTGEQHNILRDILLRHLQLNFGAYYTKVEKELETLRALVKDQAMHIADLKEMRSMINVDTAEVVKNAYKDETEDLVKRLDLLEKAVANHVELTDALGAASPKFGLIDVNDVKDVILSTPGSVFHLKDLSSEEWDDLFKDVTIRLECVAPARRTHGITAAHACTGCTRMHVRAIAS